MSKINATYSSGYYIRPDMDIRKLEELKKKEQKEQRRKRHRQGGDGEEDNNNNEEDTIKNLRSLSPETLLQKRNQRIDSILSNASRHHHNMNNNNNNNKDGGGEKEMRLRQTFAIPFDLYCNHCNRRIARQTHVYTDRFPSIYPDLFLSPDPNNNNKEERSVNTEAVKLFKARRMPSNFFLKIKCQFCGHHFLLETDFITPKITGGYHCIRHCRRLDGDALYLNNLNSEAMKVERERQLKMEEEETVADRLERENEKQETLRRMEESIYSALSEQEAQRQLCKASWAMEEGEALSHEDSFNPPPHHHNNNSMGKVLLEQLEQLRRNNNNNTERIIREGTHTGDKIQEQEDNNNEEKEKEDDEIVINKDEIYERWKEIQQQQQRNHQPLPQYSSSSHREGGEAEATAPTLPTAIAIEGRAPHTEGLLQTKKKNRFFDSDEDEDEDDNNKKDTVNLVQSVTSTATATAGKKKSALSRLLDSDEDSN